MSHGQAVNRTVVSDHVDRAPVGETRNGKRCEIRERGLVVERRCEELARLGDEALVLREAALGLVELSGADGGGGKVGQEHCRALLGLAEATRFAIVDDEGSEDSFAIVEWERHHRTRPLCCVRLPMLGRQPRGPLDVFGHDWRVEGHGGGVAPDRRHRRGDILVRQPDACADVPDASGVVVLPDGVRVGGERPAGKGEDLGQHRLDVERAEERRGSLEEEPQSSEILGEAPFGVV